MFFAFARRHSRFTLCAAAVLCGIMLPAPRSLFGCGPDFPNSLLDGGDNALLVAPVADFVGELRRMSLVETRFQAFPILGGVGAPSYSEQTAGAEITDLAAALKRAKVPRDEAERICKAYRAAREKLNKYLGGLEQWNNTRPMEFDGRKMQHGEATGPRPVFPAIELPAGLPAEFADYLEGALAWHNPAMTGKSEARGHWERLLHRPPQERQFKSTWAAFMLGRAHEEKEPDKAVDYFKQVRDLARHGFADSDGLAAASLGLEARVHLRQQKYGPALELYLEQLATGDPTAGPSLTFTAAAVSAKGQDALKPLALNPRTQRVLTAYVISRQRTYSTYVEPAPQDGDGQPQPKGDIVHAWLDAVEAADVKDVDSAAKLALAAYQANDMLVAWRWMKRAPNSPVTQWLHAKLLLREGKIAPAADLLANVVHAFPIEPPSTNQLVTPQLKNTLSVEATGNNPPRITADRQALGELGALRLSRRDYVQSLDALLNAGFWMDAAYVAERVLTADELKSYVDGYWPPVTPAQAAEEQEKYGESEISPMRLRTQIRYLLARRLMRSFRGDEARDYYPVEWMPQYLVLAQALRTGWDEALPAEQRAKALFLAATITRTNGLELIGTEVEPDWRIHAGNYQEGVSVSTRATNENAKALVAGEDELDRARRHKPDPDLRWHYRAQAGALAWEAAKLVPDNFEEATHMLLTGGGWIDSCGAEGADTLYFQAAALAWEAAKHMPDNSEDTARFLCVAGGWLKYRHPKEADIFYKALVRRNRKTAIGMEADRIRWFPRLDEQGHVIPRKSSRLESMPQPALPEPSTTLPPDATGNEAAWDYPVPGKSYIVHAGDGLAEIARAASILGHAITVDQLIGVNPGLEATRLRIGQKIRIPGGQATSDSTPAPTEPTPTPDQEHTPEPPPNPLPDQPPPAGPET
jgi:hypothetical protein